jgi:hypothetical protein
LTSRVITIKKVFQERGVKMGTMAVLAQANRGSFDQIIAILSIIVVLLIGITALVALIVLFVRRIKGARRKATQLGYSGIRCYLRAIPKNDSERRDAVDMFSKGIVLCLLGILFAPLLIIGVIPLYYGGRKLGMILIGDKFSTTESSAPQPPAAEM